ncbi:I78 family peptidase inhibitor [Achromobacter sp. D10]|uniref:I78 family peptidase inhibitor n=1 Tax=Achromobacter sp. D10 TaxID=3110765 RepID=UPI002B463A0F|nr:I78 family peptidase inhibitor [Achromobacter sp. D10]MEB3097315.1 I78 family peptidase inhibitor [Achromobacter sp. D10]
MIRKLIPFLLVASLTACANTGAPRSSSTPAASSSSSSSSSADAGTSYGGSSYGSSSMGGGKTCDAAALQSQIGQKATPSVMEDLRTRSGSATARMLRPGQLVTMEYNATRLNLIVDDKDIMTAIRCG